MAVDVVVVNYKTPDLLRDFIKSYEESAWDGCRLWVMDVEPEVYLPYTDTIYDYTRFVENVGYARACNFGARDGVNDVIVFANADTLLTPGLSDCHDALLSHHDWGVLGPRQIDEFNRITAGGIFGTDRSIGQRGWQELDRGQCSDIREDAKSVSGSLYFVKRLVWEQMTRCPYMQAAYPDIEGGFIPTPEESYALNKVKAIRLANTARPTIEPTDFTLDEFTRIEKYNLELVERKNDKNTSN